MSRAVLLDLDGTLSDSRPGIAESLLHMLAELGHNPAVAGDVTWAVGPPIGHSIRMLLGKYNDDRVDLGVATYRARYSAVGLYQCAVYPGIPELLAVLSGAGVALNVATSKRKDYAERVIDYLGLRQYLPNVYGALPGGGLDDKKDLLAEILRVEGHDPATTIMVGDRMHDIDAAKANSLRSIGVLWGYGGETELREAGADVIVTAPGELTNVI